jgi:hypothetical protein
MYFLSAGQNVVQRCTRVEMLHEKKLFQIQFFLRLMIDDKQREETNIYNDIGVTKSYL